MKIHVEGYFKEWGFTIADKYIPCDVPGFEGYVSDDIMHIDPKGMGGRASVEYPENWMASTRKLHNKLEGRHKDWLYAGNCLKFLVLKPEHKWSELFKATAFYRNNIEPFLGERAKLLTHITELIETLNPFK